MAYKRTVSSMADTAKLPTHIESCKLEINSDDHGDGHEYRRAPIPWSLGMMIESAVKLWEILSLSLYMKINANYRGLVGRVHISCLGREMCTCEINPILWLIHRLMRDPLIVPLRQLSELESWSRRKVRRKTCRSRNAVVELGCNQNKRSCHGRYFHSYLHWKWKY